jgi:hypothetical protein
MFPWLWYSFAGEQTLLRTKKGLEYSELIIQTKLHQAKESFFLLIFHLFSLLIEQKTNICFAVVLCGFFF